MKGISAILATVLIVVITVAIVGLAYGWATGLFKMTSEATEEQVGGVTENLQKSVDIVALKCYNSTNPEIYISGMINLADTGGPVIPPQPETNTIAFSVKNTGTGAIETGDLSAFLNNTPIGDNFSPVLDDIAAVTLDVGEIKSFEYSSVNEHTDNQAWILKIDAPAGPVEKSVICTPVVY